MFFLWLPMYWAYLNFKVWVIWAYDILLFFPEVVGEFVVYLFVGEPFFYIWEFQYGFQTLNVVYMSLWIAHAFIQLVDVVLFHHIRERLCHI